MKFDFTGTHYERSHAAAEGLELLMTHFDGEDWLLIDGPGEAHGFSGTRQGSLLVCPTDHQNRLALNRLLPHTAPRAMGRNTATFGLGDRLALAGYAHLLTLEGRSVLPILAQQSMRELNLTRRTYADVLDAAAWAVLKAGWTHGYGADGDHLKSIADIQTALDCGYSMITLDCSEALRPEEKDPVACYSGAIALAKRVYFDLILPTGRPIDFELSLDETSARTTPEAHAFVAQSLSDAGVVLNSLAPRFVGEFQKGVDYIGNLEEFRHDLRAHVDIANQFGYKISIHSGSDKFAVFPIIGEETGSRVHVKTSGTNWLEAVRVIAQNDPALYRALHQNALAHLEEARAYYAVHADTASIRPLDETPDEALPAYLDENDARQLMHITYGFQLNHPELRPRLFQTLETHRKSYQAALQAHIGRHLDGLGFKYKERYP